MLFNGCISYYNISATQLAEQMKREQKPEATTQIMPVAPLILSNKYVANNVEKLLCTNSKGDTIWFYPNQNTELEITTKSGDVITMYFDTVVLEGTKLSGLRSRLLNLKREVELSEITKIEIYAESGKTESVHEK